MQKGINKAIGASTLFACLTCLVRPEMEIISFRNAGMRDDGCHLPQLRLPFFFVSGETDVWLNAISSFLN